MRFSIASAAACLSACLVPVSALVGDEYKVPGDNPLTYCNLTKEYIDIKSVDISPNPPVGNADLTITASGHVEKPIEKGATVAVSVKWGLITIVRRTLDLCDQLKNVELECPVQGDILIKKSIGLPPIPDGTFVVHAEVNTVDHNLITCMDASVSIHKSGFLNIEL